MMAEKYAGLNPYQFGNNNPSRFNDPSGSLSDDAAARHHPDGIQMGDGSWLGGGIWDDGWFEGSGGSGGSDGGGGGFGNYSYAGFWINYLQNVPADGITHIYDDENAANTLYYNYRQLNGTSTFDTPNDDGLYYTDRDLVGYYVFIGNSYHDHSLHDENREDRSEWMEAPIAILESAILAKDLTVHSINAAQKLANTVSVVKNSIINLDEARFAKGLTVDGAGRAVGAVAVVYNGYELLNHPTWGRGLETVISGVSLVPGWGWIVGGTYFLANLGWEAYSGKSIQKSIDGE
jgi:hypothetical protein